MLTFIQALIAFILLIVILVTVHEFGHYIVARLFNVKVLRFSIGIGKPLWSIRYGKDKTEFSIAPFPIGGYVKMLGEDKEESMDNVDLADLPRAFNRQSLKVRAAIVAAGPSFNLIFAILVYMLVFLLGVTGMKAIVGEVTPNSLAASAGFEKGQQVIEVEGESTLRWDSVMQRTLEQLMEGNAAIKFLVHNEQGEEKQLVLDTGNLSINDVAGGELFEKLGMQPFQIHLPAIVGKILAESPAAKGGLQTGDKIVAVDNVTVESWYQWANYIAQHPKQTIKAEIERNQQRLSLTLIPEEVEGRGRLGIYPQSYIIPDKYLVIERYGIIDALIQGTQRFWQETLLTLRLLKKMLTLEISPKYIGGPITIADYAGKFVERGLISFLLFLGVVSISLGVLNLLPIPVLDGGHLFLYLFEGIKGRPLAERTQIVIQNIGITILFGLMGLALFNDLTRLLWGE